MAAIAKFVSYDGGIAFSDSVLKIQKRDEERGRLIPIENVIGIDVAEPLLGDDGCIRVQIAGKKPSIKNTVYFDEEQFGDALSFKMAFDSFREQASPALPPLEMFQPTAIARRPQKERARYATQERPRRPAGQTKRKRRFRWWHILVALLAIGVVANAGEKDKKENQKEENVISAMYEATPSPEPTVEPTPGATPFAGYTSPPAVTSPPAHEQTQTIVYVTNTGSKYHRAGCRHLSDSKIEMTLEQAKKNYEPCGTCHPPT